MPHNLTPVDYREYRVRVTPASKKEYVKKGKGDALEIAVRERAENGRANARVRGLIAAHFSLPVKNVLIIKGSQQPAKMVRVYGA